MLIIFLYVDDLIFTGDFCIEDYRSVMENKFEMTDLGIMKYFLWINDPNLCKNTTEYTNNHKNKDAVEITLHFINIKELKLVYRHDGNKLARVLVAYLWEDMWRLHAFEICVTMRLEGLYIIEKQWKPYTSKNLTLGGEIPECGPRWVTWYINFLGS